MSLLFLFFLLFFFSSSQSSSEPPSFSLPDRFLSKPINSSADPQEYVDPTYPPPALPATSSACSQLILAHSFANTYGLPPTTVPYSPPLSNCSAPWTRIILTLSVSSSGDQYDRIAAVWLAGGVEVLRTSTAEPTPAGVFWHVKKDVTKYHSLLAKPTNVSMMLENLINDEFTGVYHCNLTLEFFPEDDDDDAYSARRISSEVMEKDLHLSSPVGKKRKMATDNDPADLILPISNVSPEAGYWFRIQNRSSDVHSRRIVVPRNAYRAVLEVYFSFHGNDEFWYSNPPDSYIEKNNLTTGRGNGAFRRVFATIDGLMAGSIVPFPVIFTGGINPLFWSPVVAMGAFNLPSYNLDVTPFLGLLLDGKPHSIGLNVTDAISFWLIDANLHLWLDPRSVSVKGKLVQYIAPPIAVARSSKFSELDGTFKIDAGIKFHFSGWVKSSFGNVTTDINQKAKLKQLIVILKDGNHKEVHLKSKVKMGVRITKNQGALLSHTAYKYKYPLMIVTENSAVENGTYTMNTTLSHLLHEERLSLYEDEVLNAKILSDSQEATGWMLVKDHSVLDGSAETQQLYQFIGSDGCYTRDVSAKDGMILKDNKTTACPPPPYLHEFFHSGPG